jgi:hypothetical protein
MRRFSRQGFLVVYSGLLTAAVTVLFTSGFGSTDAAQQRFDTLTVQRINIVEPDGTLRMVLSNNRRIQTLPPDQQQAEIARFLETHPLGAGTRTILTNDQRPGTPDATRSALAFIDPSRRERTRLGVTAAGDPALEFLNENGDVTHKYPPAGASAPQATSGSPNR